MTFLYPEKEMSASLCLLLSLATNQNVATTPAHRLGEAWWKQRHEHCVEITKQGADRELIFIGDSITQGWEGGGKATWEKYYAGRKAANFGFSGDRTEHVLWRMDNGEILGMHPKLAIIMIGTNNIGHKSSGATETAEGVKLIVEKLRKNMPETKILLLGIFPRGANNSDAMRIATDAATAQFKSLHDGVHVFFEDERKIYLTTTGDIWKNLMPDMLHPNAFGYELWAKAMEPTVRRLLGEGR